MRGGERSAPGALLGTARIRTSLTPCVGPWHEKPRFSPADMLHRTLLDGLEVQLDRGNGQLESATWTDVYGPAALSGKASWRSVFSSQPSASAADAQVP